MTLSHVELASGRLLRLREVRMRSTYGGLLEGYPCKRLNDRILSGVDSMARRTWPGTPVQVIEPVRTRPDGDATEGLPFGPLERLPSVIVAGWFTSEPVDPALDAVLCHSRLAVVWFQDDAVLPAGQAAGAFGEVDWDAYALDEER
ncbi:hypothetical protein [Micromonospora sp. CPCC 205556]|uniref:hypothetical protein n=1 Tax=Micromonospora sp. CPCC 205556 TaxID=3122398 RepID=UPI002FF18C80